MDQNRSAHVAWIQLEMFDPATVAQWFCRELWFTLDSAAGGAIYIHNGNCRLLLTKRSRQVKAYESDAFFAGYEHLALEAPDIGAALRFCRERGMTLKTDGGAAFYNPKVWGTGMYYFNILTDFGVTVEISQRLDRLAHSEGEKLVVGLEHLGVEVSDLQRSIEYYTGLGFVIGYPPVENIAAQGGRVLCAMMVLDDMVAELFQFVGKTGYQENVNNGVRGLLLTREGASGCGRLSIGPDGELAVVR